MNFNLQPKNLKNDILYLLPLSENQFESLYLLASDPLVWQQHPNKERYKKKVFHNFFDGAMQSKGAFFICDVKTQEAIGCSRFYDLDLENNSVLIGYTFLSRKFWGKGYNKNLKTLMINYAFQFIEKVVFHIGSENIRSQKSITKLGAIKIEEKKIAYFGENDNLNFVYEIKKADWLINNS